MATVQLSLAKGATLDGAAGGTCSEATGGAAPAGEVDLNIANGTSKEAVLKALDIFEAKIIQSINLP
jgi:hypothetical protein